MKKLTLFIAALLLLALAMFAPCAHAQEGMKTYNYVDNGLLWATAQNKATAEACTSDIFTWGWAGTISLQGQVLGKNTGNQDTTIVYYYIQEANWFDVLAMKAPADSLAGCDTLYGKQFGKIMDISHNVDGTYCGRIYAVFDGPDSAKSFNVRKCLTPAK